MGTPRRIRVDKFTPAEKAIYDAQVEVEKSGADPLLTEATILLSQARNKVADYVESESQEKIRQERKTAWIQGQMKINNISECQLGDIWDTMGYGYKYLNK